MNQKEISEIKRRLNTEKSNITKIYTAFVNTNKLIISEAELELGLMGSKDGDRVLGLMKKVLSGRVGTNLLNIQFSTSQVTDDPEYALLYQLRNSRLEDPDSRKKLLNKIIENYKTEENYLILLAFDTYDVFNYHSDGKKSEESTEQFSYIMCAVCPVTDASDDISYSVSENRFCRKTCNPSICPPDVGFMFPAFDDRATNIYGALYYTKSKQDSKSDLAESLFHTGPLPLPAAVQKQNFDDILADATEKTSGLPIIRSLCAQVNQALETHKLEKIPEPLTVTRQDVREMMQTAGVSENSIRKCEQSFDDCFGVNASVMPQNILETGKFEIKTPDVVIRVSPQHTDLVETRIIDGVRYILIRADEGAEVNGVNITIETK